MANVRIAQIGQVAVNRPIYEIFMNGRKYAALVNLDNQLEFIPPTVLKSLGINSVYADVFQRSLTPELINALGFTSGKTSFDSRFPVVNYGSGLGWAADFKTYVGWTGLVPTAYITMTV